MSDLLPTRDELGYSIDSQRAAQLEIDTALKHNDVIIALVKGLVSTSGTVLTAAGIPFAGTGAQLAKMAIDAVADRS